MRDKKIFTIPNVLTVARLFILIPIVHHIVHLNQWWALFWILCSIASDNLDGFIARRFNQQSDLGRILDPVTDKINIVVVLAVLTFTPHYGFPFWFFVFTITRELLILLGGWIIILQKHNVLEANRAGKMSAFTTGFMILFFVMRWQPYGWILLWITLILTIVSTWTYIRIFRKAVQSTK
ncbi:CDP-alcohol phosphatidyltransferase family protein [candidate division KSB1 bacterium]|nr:CDP-alcohol phosphatidyltransferase family protein [candidate division KSB1 bacterium]